MAFARTSTDSRLEASKGSEKNMVQKNRINKEKIKKIKRKKAYLRLIKRSNKHLEKKEAREVLQSEIRRTAGSGLFYHQGTK
jgi:phosphoribosylamine-glycine ligase